jgi:ATP-dependent DNA ligase
MLARLERKLPRGDPWRYEPTLDCFRGLLWRARRRSVHLLSRYLKDLSRAFPEVWPPDEIYRSTRSLTGRS